jgi:hypothetical protein
VSSAFGDPKQESAYYCSSVIISSDLTWLLEMDQETFEVMWEMSKPGGEAEGCFLRIHQTNYFTVDIKDAIPTRELPDVCQFQLASFYL